MRSDVRKRADLALTLMAGEGISLWTEIRGRLGLYAGSSQRLRLALEREGLVTVVRGKFGRFPYDILILTADGKAYVAELGVPAVTSEWERLVEQHHGTRYLTHNLAVLLFAYQARKRGWGVEVLPEPPKPYLKPDVLVTKDGQRVFVEVEVLRHPRKQRGGADNTWLRKWINQHRVQGYVAVCTLTPARMAGIVTALKPHFPGLATDLMTLLKHPDCELWVAKW